jgi:hypothetical protein
MLVDILSGEIVIREEDFIERHGLVWNQFLLGDQATHKANYR